MLVIVPLAENPVLLKLLELVKVPVDAVQRTAATPLVRICTLALRQGLPALPLQLPQFLPDLALTICPVAAHIPHIGLDSFQPVL